MALGVAGQAPRPVVDKLIAVRLFVDRATAVRPSFGLDAEAAPAVHHICPRLDGMPPALELAAARVRIISPPEIAARLEDRFGLLVSGSRTALPRHQTLPAAIDLSGSTVG
jgi:predicted ATPase